MQYVERFEQLLRANEIADEGKKAAICLSTMGPVAYHTLANLLAPSTPAKKNYSALIQAKEKFHISKPLVIVQRYRFYSRFYKPNESTATCITSTHYPV